MIRSNFGPHSKFRGQKSDQTGRFSVVQSGSRISLGVSSLGFQQTWDHWHSYLGRPILLSKVYFSKSQVLVGFLLDQQIRLYPYGDPSLDRLRSPIFFCSSNFFSGDFSTAKHTGRVPISFLPSELFSLHFF